MNAILKQVFAMEHLYKTQFSKISEEEKYVTYVDAQLLDMYMHNFAFVKDPNTLHEVIASLPIESSFLRIEFEGTLEGDCPLKNGVKPLVTTYAFYHRKTDGALIPSHPEAKVLKANQGELLKTGIAIDIVMNAIDSGLDFATRRANRKALVYQDETKKVDLYICLYQGQAIGNIEVCANAHWAKFEDFDVAAAFQRQGFGSTMLSHLIRESRDRGIEDVYLLTDESETAKHMYEKCGFKAVGQKTELLYFFK